MTSRRDRQIINGYRAIAVVVIALLVLYGLRPF